MTMKSGLDDYAAMIGVAAADGAILELPFSAQVEGRTGFFHGGVIAGLLEMAAWQCVRSIVTTDILPTPIVTTITYLRGARPGTLHAAAESTFRTRRLLHSGAVAWQDHRDRPSVEAKWQFLLPDRGFDRVG